MVCSDGRVIARPETHIILLIDFETSTPFLCLCGCAHVYRCVCVPASYPYLYRNIHVRAYVTNYDIEVTVAYTVHTSTKELPQLGIEKKKQYWITDIGVFFLFPAHPPSITLCRSISFALSLSRSPTERRLLLLISSYTHTMHVCTRTVWMSECIWRERICIIFKFCSRQYISSVGLGPLRVCSE